MTNEEAIRWCQDHNVTVDFSQRLVPRTYRCYIYATFAPALPQPIGEADTFLEAVQLAASNKEYSEICDVMTT